MSFGDIIQYGEDDLQSVSSIAVTLGSTPTEGNLLVACHFTGHANSIGPSGFTETATLTDNSNNDQGAIYYKVAGSGESSTITCTSGSTDENMLCVLEVEGPWNASPLDVYATAGPSNTNTRDTGTTGTTAQVDEFAVAIITIRKAGGSSYTTDNWTNSFSVLYNAQEIQTNYKMLGVATKLLSSTQTVTTSTEIYDTGALVSRVSMGGVAVFKKQAAGGTLSIPVAMRTYRNMRT